MSNYKIGKVIGVSGEKLEVSLVPEEDSLGVPECMSIDVTTETGPETILIGQPGSFIKVETSQGCLLCMVSDIRMQETTPSASEINAAKTDETYILNTPKRILIALPFGTIDTDGNFDKGADVLPTVNSDVYAVLPKTIDDIYSSYAEGNFKLGKLSLAPTQDAKINLDAFLSRHGAILGQTGSGKSWTVASFLQKIADLKQSTMVLFDLHGEYKDAFGEYADYIDASEIEVPYWLMNSEELLDLMVDRSSSNAPNQIAVFRDLLQEAKRSYPENRELGIPIEEINIDTPVYFDFPSIIQRLEALNVQMVPGKTSNLIKGDLNGKFSRLLIRVNSRLNDARYNCVFKPQTYNTSASMNDLFRKLLGEEASPKKLTIIDMSPIPFDVRTSVISLIMRCLFDFSYWYKKLYDTAYPLAIFCDEAHIYLKDNDPSCASAKMSAEKIAKEGRKYGISLTVISQRPREVSATILSQCNTFLCLRITNPDDQSYVKRLLPDSVSGIINMFSSLRRGECILLGDSVIMPTRIKIDKPNPQPSSDDTSFYEAWSQAHEAIDVERVLGAWRKQSTE